MLLRLKDCLNLVKWYTVLKRDNLAFLGVTKCGSDGFGSTGVCVIKKKKLELVSNEVSSEENLLIISGKTDSQTQTTSEETTEETTSQKAQSNSEEWQTTSEEAIMSVNNEVIIHESITISD